MDFQLPQTEPLRGSIRRGQKARAMGLPESSCPYRSNGPAGAHYRAWMTGWANPDAVVPKTTAGTRTGRPSREKGAPASSEPEGTGPARLHVAGPAPKRKRKIGDDELLGQRVADLLAEERARIVTAQPGLSLRCKACTRAVGRPPLRLEVLDHDDDCRVLRWERALLAHRDQIIARLEADEATAGDEEAAA